MVLNYIWMFLICDLILITLFNRKKTILDNLKSVEKASVQSLINFWIIYIKTKKLYCLNNKLYKINDKYELIYYKNVSHFKKRDSRNIFIYYERTKRD